VGTRKCCPHQRRTAFTAERLGIARVTAEESLAASADESRESPKDCPAQPHAYQMTCPASAENRVHDRETEYGTRDSRKNVDRISGP